MNAISILLVQTKSEATIEIALLLLVAGIIGFVTAWLYTRSVFMAKIKVVDSENDSLKNVIVNLNADKGNLYKRLHEKDTEMEPLIRKIETLEALHAEAVKENDQLKMKNRRDEYFPDEKDDSLAQIARRRYLLNYLSFGTATEAERMTLR